MPVSPPIELVSSGRLSPPLRTPSVLAISWLSDESFASLVVLVIHTVLVK